MGEVRTAADRRRSFGVPPILLLLIGVIAFVIAAPPAARGAQNNAGSNAARQKKADSQTPGKGATPTPKPTPTPTRKPTATPTPEGRTRLTEDHEFQYEMLRQQTALTQAYAGGVARLVGSLLWPAVCIVGLVLGARILRKWLEQRMLADAASPVLAARAVAANSQFSVPTRDLASVSTASQTVATEYQTLAKSTGKQVPSEIEMLAKPLDNAATPTLAKARADVEEYADRAFKTMLYSQYELLALAATRAVTYGEAGSLYANAQSRGYSGTFTAWQNFLVRTGLLQAPAAGSSASTVIIATDLGKMFLGWFDARGYGKQTFTLSGRDI